MKNIITYISRMLASLSRNSNKDKPLEFSFNDVINNIHQKNIILKDQNEILAKSYEALLQNNVYQAQSTKIAMLRTQRDVLQTEMKYYLSQRGSEQYKNIRSKLDAINNQILTMEI